MNLQIPMWASLIIANMHIIADNYITAMLWIALAIGTVILQAKFN